MTLYEYCLTPTSQFYYCGLPLRMDSYSKCQFSCRYCFASSRGGRRGLPGMQIADPEQLAHTLNRLTSGAPRTVVEEFLAERQPIHLGGMSDPFSPIENVRGVTLRILEVLADHQYPTIISTKATMYAQDRYLDCLKRGRFIVQSSIIGTEEKFVKQVDFGTPGPAAQLQALRQVASEGIPTACRIQPLIPTREADAESVIDACADAGVRHVAVEHLKLPLEREWSGTPRISSILGFDLAQYYAREGAKRTGREWVLPLEARIEAVLALRGRAHDEGLTFGAADNDLLLLGDGECCCSGADLVPGFSTYFRHNYAEAARRGLRSGIVSLDSLNDTWFPEGSMSRYVNSHSRLPAIHGRGANVDEYIRRNWNGRPNGCSPASIFGVSATGESDDHGFRLYSVSDRVRELRRLS